MEDAQLFRITKALADPRRFAIFESLAKEPVSACQQLCERFPVTKATLSHHIGELEAAGLVRVEKQGKFLQVRLCKETWKAYRKELRKRIG